MTNSVSSAGPKLYILLPAYNEERALAELIPAIGAALRSEPMPYEICVVDDGSRDGSVALLETLKQQWPVRLLRHEINKGYGAALNTGFSWIAANAQPDDVALSLDADNTHSPVYFMPMVRRLQEGFDVVTASYMMKGGEAIGVPFKRKIFSTAANGLLRLTCRVPGTYAYTNGFRAYRVAALKRAAMQYRDKLVEETGFPGGTELLLKVAQFGVRTSEVPFILRYDRRGGQSKIRIVRTIRCYLQLIGRFAYRSAPAALPRS